MMSEIMLRKKQMQNKINYSPIAEKDLDGIWSYIENELLKLSVAEYTINGIMDVIDQLKFFRKKEAGLFLMADLTVVTDLLFIKSIWYSTIYRQITFILTIYMENGII